MQTDHDFHPLTVLAVVDETADTRSFVLDVPPTLADTFAYAAGQFVTVRAEIDGAEVVRCYSMSSSPDVGDPFTITVKRVPGGVLSNRLNDSLAAGATIDVLGPGGLFVLHDADVPIVAFAAGSGITPIFGIVKTALATTTRDVVLVDANRDAGSVIFGEALAGLEAAHPGRFTVHRHLDAESGLPDGAALRGFVGERTDAHFYVCGPPPYLDLVEEMLAGIGIRPGQLFVERFVIPGEIPAIVESSHTDEVVVVLSGRTTTVDYRLGDTLLETARRAGLSPPFSCELGSCATCMARLREGAATLRVNNALAPDELDAGWVLTCQAVPTSRRVVVDYDA
ncbi:MAG: ferredoxin--NADP reductase [Actinomycetes bacterium]